MKNHKSWMFVSILSSLLYFGCSDVSNESTEVEEQPDNQCTNTCDTSLCDGNSAIYKCADLDGDGCKELKKESEPCAEGLVCVNGACVSSDSTCENPCDGEPQCDGDKLKVCKVGEDGCKVWVTEDCPDGMTCSNGVCGNDNPTCENSCSEPSICEGENSYKLCLDTNGDGCYEWSDVTPCADGLSCSDGQCKKACTNDCTPDSKECDGTTGFKTCTDTDGDGCYEWSSVTKCTDGSTCSKGECKKTSSTCTNACTSGKKQCDGTTGFKTCTDTNGDGCYEWSSVTKCTGGMTCSDGQCKKTCTNACTSGAKQCDGTTGYMTCGDLNGDGCTEWSSVTKCTDGKTCSGGTCTKPACQYTTAVDPGWHPLPGQSSPGKIETSSTNTAKGPFYDDYLYNMEGTIKVGIRPAWGSTIVFFGEADKPYSNTIDSWDTGREVQVAIYDDSRHIQSCAYNASCSGKPGSLCPEITHLGWNPVQGGDECEHGSETTEKSESNGIIQTTTQPLQWNPEWNVPDCRTTECPMAAVKTDVRFKQRLRFVDSHIVEIFYSIEGDSMEHTYTNQEIPTLYAGYGKNNVGDYLRLMKPDGTELHISNETTSQIVTEPWATLQNANLDYGVGLFYENGARNDDLQIEMRGYQLTDENKYNNFRAMIPFGLPANGTVNARVYLILGSFETIKDKAHWLMSNLRPFGSLDYPANNASVSGKVEVGGWALDNKGVKSVQAVIDESKTFNLSYGAARPDVCKVWVGYPNCHRKESGNVGYSGQIDVSGLDPNCPHLLEIVAYDEEGKRTIARHILKIK